MKKLVLAIAVVASFASCEKQTAKVETGTLSINPLVEVTSNADKKSGDVERGTTPVYVSSIDVNTNMNGLETDNHFSIVDDGTAGAAPGYIIEDVPLGTNIISATTSPVDGITLRRMFQTSTNNTVSSDWSQDDVTGLIAAQAIDHGYEGFKDYTQGHIPPYAIYDGSVSALLVDDQITNVNIPMDTNYGRSLFSIGAENAYDLAHYNITIRAKFYNEDGVVVYNHQVIIDGGTTATIGMWSDELSVEGAKIEFTMEWRADGAADVLKTATATINLHAKSDMYTKIILKRSTFVVEQTGLTFSYDPIVPGDDDIIIN